MIDSSWGEDGKKTSGSQRPYYKRTKSLRGKERKSRLAVKLLIKIVWNWQKNKQIDQRTE